MTFRTLALSTVAALAVSASPAAAPGDGTRVVEITARRFQFTPAEVALQRGEPVVLRLHSEDVTHGFYMKALGIDATIEPDRITNVLVRPEAPGRYTVICDHFCGSGHGGMKLTIVVE
ncbi:MAG TPA: cupredoxin domain-containing protein [Anaeromyxobacteraceae bacterium]|nr:cupredoxin domain-containing protein [Anaeromyxobacteraceae bacterium]